MSCVVHFLLRHLMHTVFRKPYSSLQVTCFADSIQRSPPVYKQYESNGEFARLEVCTAELLNVHDFRGLTPYGLVVTDFSQALRFFKTSSTVYEMASTNSPEISIFSIKTITYKLAIANSWNVICVRLFLLSHEFSLKLFIPCKMHGMNNFIL